VRASTLAFGAVWAVLSGESGESAVFRNDKEMSGSRYQTVFHREGNTRARRRLSADITDQLVRL